MKIKFTIDGHDNIIELNWSNINDRAKENRITNVVDGVIKEKLGEKHTGVDFDDMTVEIDSVEFNEE